MFELYKRVKQEMRKERELKKDMLRIARMPLDYEALQNIVNEVAANDVKVEIKFETGQIMTIERKHSEKPLSFKEQYQNFRNQI